MSICSKWLMFVSSGRYTHIDFRNVDVPSVKPFHSGMSSPSSNGHWYACVVSHAFYSQFADRERNKLPRWYQYLSLSFQNRGGPLLSPKFGCWGMPIFSWAIFAIYSIIQINRNVMWELYSYCTYCRVFHYFFMFFKQVNFSANPWGGSECCSLANIWRKRQG